MADNWDTAINELLDDFFRAEAESNGLKASASEIAKQKKEADQRVEAAREQLAKMLTEAGVTTENHPRAQITLASGRVTLQVAPDADVETLPIDMVRIKKEADKAAIQAALTEGQKVPGYSLAQGAPSLRIKPVKEKVNG